MTRHLRRFEILLPLRLNTGEPVPPALIEATRREIEDQFGALSLESQVIHGLDRDSGNQEDRLIRLFADVSDSAESLAFFHLKKKLWQQRFQQEAIYVVTFPIEVM